MNKEEFQMAVQDLKRMVSMPDIIIKRYGIAIPKNRKIACPFHSENTASMHIYADHYHCFGCGAHGDIIEFVSQMENLTKYEAYLQLGGQTTYEVSEKQKNMQMYDRMEKETDRRLCEARKQLADKLHMLQEKFEKQEPFSDEWERTYQEYFSVERKLDYLEEELRVLNRNKKGKCMDKSG